jgi:hypothetical protein
MPELAADYAMCGDLILRRLHEPGPGRIQVLTGPRQVGKTTRRSMRRSKGSRPRLLASVFLITSHPPSYRLHTFVWKVLHGV